MQTAFCKYSLVAAVCVLALSGPKPVDAQAHDAAPPAQLQLQDVITAGINALAAGNNAAAEKLFGQALALQPSSRMILNNLALAIARQGRDDEAIALYERALELAPTDAITRHNLGVAYFRAHRYLLALPLLEAYATDTPTFQSLDLAGLDLFALDRYGEAVVYLAQASRLQPADLPTLDMLGKAYLRTRDYAGVRDVFTRVMAINPDSPEAHAMLAMAQDKLYREEDAIHEFKAALAVDPHYPGAHAGLGMIYWRNDNLDAAEAEFKEELSRYPQDPVANCTMGRILQRRNDPSRAVAYLKAALAVNPSYKDALLALGQCEIAMSQPEQAVEPLRKVVELGGDAQAHYILGTALIRMGRSAEGAHEREICQRMLAAERAGTNGKAH